MASTSAADCYIERGAAGSSRLGAKGAAAGTGEAAAGAGAGTAVAAGTGTGGHAETTASVTATPRTKPRTPESLHEQRWDGDCIDHEATL